MADSSNWETRKETIVLGSAKPDLLVAFDEPAWRVWVQKYHKTFVSRNLEDDHRHMERRAAFKQLFELGDPVEETMRKVLDLQASFHAEDHSLTGRDFHDRKQGLALKRYKEDITIQRRYFEFLARRCGLEMEKYDLTSDMVPPQIGSNLTPTTPTTPTQDQDMFGDQEANETYLEGSGEPNTGGPFERNMSEEYLSHDPMDDLSLDDGSGDHNPLFDESPQPNAYPNPHTIGTYSQTSLAAGWENMPPIPPWEGGTATGFPDYTSHPQGTSAQNNTRNDLYGSGSGLDFGSGFESDSGFGMDSGLGQVGSGSGFGSGYGSQYNQSSRDGNDNFGAQAFSHQGHGHNRSASQPTGSLYDAYESRLFHHHQHQPTPPLTTNPFGGPSLYPPGPVADPRRPSSLSQTFQASPPPAAVLDPPAPVSDDESGTQLRTTIANVDHNVRIERYHNRFWVLHCRLCPGRVFTSGQGVYVHCSLGNDQHKALIASDHSFLTALRYAATRVVDATVANVALHNGG